ncbi:nucleoside phosphorylase domain-containing protein [Aspergillus spectabilis]
MRHSSFPNDFYTIAWICTSPDSLAVSMALLDEEHGLPQPRATPTSDPNTYHLGRVSELNIAMACLPSGQTGTGSTTGVAENMRRSFKRIQFAILVGDGGGCPYVNPNRDGGIKDVRLGDVVVSYPTRTYTGVVQYDYGRMLSGGEIERKDWFSPPPRKVLSAVDMLRAYHSRPVNAVNEMVGMLEGLGREYAYPGEGLDRLYRTDYEHVAGVETCAVHDEGALIERVSRPTPSQPRVHYGTIASGNMVIRSAVERDRINSRFNDTVLCIDMEAAGFMNCFPGLVIRGISNYCDSHKDDQWKRRANAAAAAYAKELLLMIDPPEEEVVSPSSTRVLKSGTLYLEESPLEMWNAVGQPLMQSRNK